MSRDLDIPLDATKVTIEVRQETPFLPKVAFTLITTASVFGASFSGYNFGLSWVEIFWRWLALWGLAMATGALAWRMIYIRERESGTDPERIDAFNATAFQLGRRTLRMVAAVLLLGAASLPMLSYLDGSGLAMPLLLGYLTLAGLLWWGRLDRWSAGVGLVLAGSLEVGWALADTFTTGDAVLRTIHLWAFAMWLGGATWNISVAVPAGIAHPNLDAVLAGARQLARFRWVVRFALPTVLVTGLLMADAYRGYDLEWWWDVPGVFIPIKLFLVFGLIAVFITCPLYRQCSQVKGVCSVDDLRQ